MGRGSWPFVAAVVACVCAGVASAQLGETSFDDLDHPAIRYASVLASDPVAGLNRRLRAGELELAFDPRYGYLQSVLSALDVPIESQVAVFSKTSLQLNLIHTRNPRVIYFNDAVSVGWIRDTFVLEVAAQDPEHGTVFYELAQQESAQPTFRPTRACLRCHHSVYTNGVPGQLVRSTPTAADGTTLPWTKNLAVDHRTPFEDRWGGWYVTGRTSGLSHMGNVVGTRPPGAAPSPDLETLADRLDVSAYLSPYSDIVALLVLEHQTHLLNLLTRLGWEARARAHESQPGVPASRLPPGRASFAFDRALSDVVDYMLFVDEVPLPGPIEGTSGFAQQFVERGPSDRQGRSLRQLDLERRLMRYPCSYLIYSPAFDGLPAEVRDAIYGRMWEILSGEDRSARYASLSAADRRAVVEILRDTKLGLPDYFGG